MKNAWAYLLAFLVLSISILPCADGATLADTELDHYELTQSDPKSDNHQDACSPFCTCNCCASLSVMCTVTTVYAVTVCHHLKHASFIEARTHSIALPIWQPPQLV